MKFHLFGDMVPVLANLSIWSTGFTVETPDHSISSASASPLAPEGTFMVNVLDALTQPYNVMHLYQ